MAKRRANLLLPTPGGPASSSGRKESARAPAAARLVAQTGDRGGGVRELDPEPVEVRFEVVGHRHERHGFGQRLQVGEARALGAL